MNKWHERPLRRLTRRERRKKLGCPVLRAEHRAWVEIRLMRLAMAFKEHYRQSAEEFIRCAPRISAAWISLIPESSHAYVFPVTL